MFTGKLRGFTVEVTGTLGRRSFDPIKENTP